MSPKKIDTSIDLRFVSECLINSLIKFHPKNYIFKPVLFIIYLFAILSLLYLFYSHHTDSFILNVTVCISIWVLLYFSNFAETLSEMKGKALRVKYNELLLNKKINVIRDNNLIKVSESDLLETDFIKVSSGDIIPLDGEVIQGIAAVDESPITGESATIYKENIEGRDLVLAGSKVVSDSLIYRPNKEIKKNITSLSIKTIKTSHNEKAITIFLLGIAIINIIMALTFFGILELLNVELNSVFIVAFIICIIPTTAAALMDTITISGLKKLLNAKLLPFNSQVIDIASDINLVVFDKTGTITTGKRELEKILPYSNISKQELMKGIYLSSYKDDTPEGSSIMSFLQAQEETTIKNTSLDKCKFIPFNSASKFSGCENGNDIYRKGAINSILELLKNNNTVINNKFIEELDNFSKKGRTPIMVIRNNEILGACILKDELKEGTKYRIAKLKSMGIKTILVTGDNYYVAKNYADEIGFDEFHSDTTPEDKKEIILTLKDKGYTVAMCGEGINDNLALSESDLGFCCLESDITTRNASDVIDLENDPLKIIQLIEISRNLLSTKGCITTFSLMSDISKYFAILPAILIPTYPFLQKIDILNLSSPESAVASSIIFNTIIVILFLPLALKGVKHLNYKTLKVVKIFFLIFGLGGLIIPFFGIKIINMFISQMFL